MSGKENSHFLEQETAFLKPKQRDFEVMESPITQKMNSYYKQKSPKILEIF